MANLDATTPQGPAPLPVIACFKWGKGYPTIYTNVLYRALRDMLKTPFRFVCITDFPVGLDDGIETIDLPEFAMERDKWNRGMWPKLCIFKPDLFAAGTPVLMMDVDIVVLRDLTPILVKLPNEGGVHLIADWPDTLERWFPKMFYKERRSNSSFVGFIVGEQTHIWTAFKDAKSEYLFAQARNDQDFIHFRAKNRVAWPLGWALSFKKSLAYHVPMNFCRKIRRPDDAYVVAFHGKPDPKELAQAPFKRWGSPEKFGYFPVKWVETYWNKYAGDDHAG